MDLESSLPKSDSEKTEAETKKELNVQVEVEKLQKMYKEDPRQRTFNALILGELGSGKTYLFRTCRLPIHVDSFDPGGTKCLRDEIAKGEIIVDSRYESEDPMKPSMFLLWKTELSRRIRENYFNAFGTYCLDGSTSWGEAIMNDQLKKAQIAGKPPRFTKDYNPQKAEIRNYIRKLIDLPCDVIITGHLETLKEARASKEDTTVVSIKYRYLTTGKGQQILPTLFDEVYVMDPRETSGAPEYRILTNACGTHLARSRLGRGGTFSVHEEPNIKALLKKAGLPIEDKPLFKPKKED